MTTTARTVQATPPPLAVVGILPQPIRVIIADTDAGFVSSLQDYLMAQPGCAVVARVESCQDALVWCEELAPHILILDWQLMFESLLPTELRGVAFLQKIKALRTPPAVIVASRLSLDEHRNAAMAAGANDFLPKTKFPQMVRPMIQRLVPQS